VKVAAAANRCCWTDPIAANGGEPLQGFEPHLCEGFYAGAASNRLIDAGWLLFSEDMTEIYAVSGDRWLPLRNRQLLAPARMEQWSKII